MTADATIADSLVSRLDAATFSKDATVRLAVDPYIESQNFPDALIQVGFENVERSIAARSVWEINAVVLTMVIAGRQSISKQTSVTEIKAWLTFVEEVIESVQTTGVVGGVLSAIDSDERYDLDKLRADQQFRSFFRLTYETR